MMQDRGERRAGVFGIEIDLAGDERAVTQISTEIKAPIDFDVPGFQHLRDNFGQQH